MKILGIYGGQDANGLTASLVKEVLAGVAAPATTEFVDLNQYQIHPDKPETTNPTLDKLAAKLKAADVWVLGTPTYFGTVAGQFKQLLDCMRHRMTRMTHKVTPCLGNLRTSIMSVSPVVLPPAWTIRSRTKPMRPWLRLTKP